MPTPSASISLKSTSAAPPSTSLQFTREDAGDSLEESVAPELVYDYQDSDDKAMEEASEENEKGQKPKKEN